MTSPGVIGPAEEKKPPGYFGEALNDAERLLKYAAEIGIDVDPGTRSAILHARTAYTHGGWDDDIGASLLMALTQLAARLKPVTAESLKAYHAEIRPTVRTYLVSALILTSIILPVSIATFITTSISNTIRDDINRANGLAVKLRAELGAPSDAGATEKRTAPAGVNTKHVIAPPADAGATVKWTPPPGVSPTDAISDLVEYAATIRTIKARALKLNELVPHQKYFFRGKSADEMNENFDKSFELPVPLTDPVDAFDHETNMYQEVRNFALVLLTDVSVFYGAISSVILPILYALLGTCAYLIRTFEDQMSTRTFTPSKANLARFLIAGIGGLVIGLFHNVTITPQASLPPLGLAFLIGYSVDVFFTLLEGLIRVFTRTPQNTPMPPSPPSPSLPSRDMPTG